MRIDELKKRFVEIYGGSKKGIRVFRAPGRINLIGEHTDYNEGFVLPVAINMYSTVLIRKRDDRLIRLCATDLYIKVVADLRNLDHYRDTGWGNYQLGVADQLQKQGLYVCGCDLLYHETLPHGCGLSSSGAIEVATCMALVCLSKDQNSDISIDKVKIAQYSQWAENEFAGVSCGIMDQFASALGKKNHAVFIDCRDYSYKLIPLNFTGYKLIIANTNKKRSLLNSCYNDRIKECDEGVKLLSKYIKGIVSIGEVDIKKYMEIEHLIHNTIIKNRIQHVVFENNRVLESIRFIERNMISEFGKLMINSHESLRDLYEVTGRELDTLFDEALKLEGVIGARMTGAGFGGCTINLVKEEGKEEFISKVGNNYYKKLGIRPCFYLCETSDGVMEVNN